MLEHIIEFSLRRRAVVAFCAVLLMAAGLWSATRIPRDAVPDITSPQVQLNTAVPALAPEEIESTVTRPIELAMSGLPGMVELRSLSKFGLSQVTMTFEDDVDIYRLRQLVTERLAEVREQLPAGLSPRLAPISTGLGEILYYTLRYRDDARDKPADRAEQLRELRLIHDYIVKPRLRATPGLAEVNAIGGYERQIVVQPDPAKLAAAGVSFDQLCEVLRASTENTGGGVLEIGGEAVVVRADTRVRDLDEIANLPVKFAGAAQPLLVRSLASVGLGSAVRTGASTEDGEETVTGAAIMLAGENGRRVARDAALKLEEIRGKLPAGVDLRIVYNRSDLVHATIRTVETNLVEGAALVAAVLLTLGAAAVIIGGSLYGAGMLVSTERGQPVKNAGLVTLGAGGGAVLLGIPLLILLRPVKQSGSTTEMRLAQ